MCRSDRCFAAVSIYNYFREYDPSVGRYVESDLIGLKGGVNTYAYASSLPLMTIDPLGLDPCCDDDRCAQLRKQIFEKSEELRETLTKYDPIADARGGFIMRGGKLTVPGGHYKKISNLQRGIKNDLAEYNRSCRNNDRWPPMPRSIDEQANRPVEAPIITPQPGISPEVPDGANSLVAPTAGMIVLLLLLSAILN